MTRCEEHERLFRSQQEAFGEWYKFRSELEGLEMLKAHSSICDARRTADEAYRKLRRSMNDLILHDRRHGCLKKNPNKSASSRRWS